MDNPDTLTTQDTNDDKQHKRTQHSKLKRGATGTSPKKTVVNPHAREG